MSFQNLIQLFQLIVLLISSVAIPLTIFLIGNRIASTRQIEEKLRNDRIEIYSKVLEPFFLVFTTEAIIKGSFKSRSGQEKTGVDLAKEKLLTLSYQDNSFKLNLLGSDKVVRAYNNLMQAFFNLKGEDKGVELIKYFAKLLLEIRKSLGNDGTKLHPFELLEWKITDARTKYQVNGKYPKM